MSVLWLRVAVVLYSLGLLHVMLTVIHRKRERVFRVAMAAFYAGVVVHVVSIVERTITASRLPANDFFESASLCALMIGLLFLFLYWRYGYESLAMFIFPLTFVLALVGELGTPVARWSGEGVRSAWLGVHVVLILVGYAALVVTAVTSIMYLIRERQIKTKKAGALKNLPPLGTLDSLMSRALSIGFVFFTLAVIVASTWASIDVGPGWIRNPRIIVSLATWGLYLVVVFFRVTAGWRGRRAAIMVIALVGCSAITWVAHAGLLNLLSR
ncbi:MAG: inner membrane protein YpjD [Acidobacteriota bacterium]